MRNAAKLIGETMYYYFENGKKNLKQNKRREYSLIRAELDVKNFGHVNHEEKDQPQYIENIQTIQRRTISHQHFSVHIFLIKSLSDRYLVTSYNRKNIITITDSTTLLNTRCRLLLVSFIS